MMTVQELETAVRYRLPLICVVFNNDMYGTIRMHQEMHYPNKVIGTDLGRVSFAKLAESCGAKGYTVRTIEQFNEAFKKCIESMEVAVIDVKVERSEEHTSELQSRGQLV